MASKHVGGPPPVVCGHRGAAAVAPENTLASFGAAVERGATWVEFDVRPTLDGTFVVHHDPTTQQGQIVSSTPRGDLDAMIPTFGEVVDRCTGIGLDIELKTDDVGMSTDKYVELVGAEIDEHCQDHSAEIIVTSFDVEVLAAFRRSRPDVATGLLFHDQPGAWAISAAIGAGHVAIAPWFQLVDEPLVESAHQAGLRVLTWTVNNPADINRVAHAGVDMIIGDDPAVIVQALLTL